MNNQNNLGYIDPQTLIARFNRDFIGGNQMMRLLFEDTGTVQNASGYPPYNIEVMGEDAFRLTLAVAGFNKDDIEITSHNGLLSIVGHNAGLDATSTEVVEENRFLHRGIANRAFTRQFHLNDYVDVIGADMLDGLLIIDLKRELPEALKPRKIEIGGVIEIAGGKKRK